MYKYKQNLNLPVPIEQKPKTCYEIKVLFKNLYAEQILVSIEFHTMDPIFGTE